MTIDQILAEVEVLDQKATPQPWVREMIQDDESYADEWYESNVIVRAIDEHDIGEMRLSSDAALVAAYRSHAPVLAAEVRRLRRLLVNIALIFITIAALSVLQIMTQGEQ